MWNLHSRQQFKNTGFPAAICPGKRNPFPAQNLK